MAEEFTLQQLRTQRRAVDNDEFRLGPSAEIVQRVGHQFLARAALALDEHRGPARRDLLDRFKDALHRLRVPQQPVQSVALRHLLLQRDILHLQRAAAQRTFDEQVQFLDVERLGDEMISAPLHRLHGHVHAAVGRHHNDDRFIRHRQRLADQSHAVIRAEPQVGHHDVHLLVLQNLQRLRAVGRYIDIEVVLQRKPEAVAGVLFIINNEDGGLFHKSSL